MLEIQALSVRIAHSVSVVFCFILVSRIKNMRVTVYFILQITVAMRTIKEPERKEIISPVI